MIELIRAARLGCLGILLAALPFSTASQDAPADLIVTGRIYTGDRTDPVEAFAVRGDRFVKVGTTASVMPLRGPSTTMIAVTDGAIVVPGLHDAHGHFVGLGTSLSELDLRDTPNQAAILEQVRAKAASGAGGWIVGRGWDQNDWPDPAWPTRAALDAVAPDTPVFLRRIDGHAAWVNSRALAVAGITRETPDPPGGRILRDAQGEPAGVLIDTAQALVSRQIPPPDDAALRERIRLADAEARRLGLTMVHDAGAGSREIELYRALSAEGALATRLYVMIDSSEATTREWFARGPLIDPSHQVTVRAVKLYADGALGSRGALLLEDYADEPGTRGLRVTSPERLAEVAAAAVDAGFQPCTHAIGDAANREILDLYERLASTRAGMRTVRPRIEHAQILDSRDIPRFGRLGVIASVQPTHCTSDMPWAPARLGAARIDEGAYPWRSLVETGAFLAAGSDFPVERPDPLLGFYAAITRQAPDGQPPGGWNPSQRLRRDEALRSFTLDAAFAAHAEADLGSIAEGKLADFVVLSRNIMTIPAAEILQTSVLRTFIGGRQVYEKE
ncbi:MAG TPA: amidohydrolase [Vicinamibacterales bacterium]